MKAGTPHQNRKQLPPSRTFWTPQQPMGVDEAPEEQLYEMFDMEASDVLGPDPGPGSPVTATEDIVLDTPGRFSRAPGDGRPITGSGTGSSGRRIMGCTTEG